MLGALYCNFMGDIDSLDEHWTTSFTQVKGGVFLHMRTCTVHTPLARSGLRACSFFANHAHCLLLNDTSFIFTSGFQLVCCPTSYHMVPLLTPFSVHLRRVIARAGGRSPLTYKQFQTVLLSIPPPPAPLHALSHSVIGDSVTPVGDDHADRYGVPTLEELGTSTA